MRQGLRICILTSVLQKLAAVVLLGATMIVTGCATPNVTTNTNGNANMDANVEIKGEAMYRERIALPADAKLIVQILDVSKMDAPAIVMAEHVNKGAKTPTPFSFTMGRDKFEAGHTYAVSARIMFGDKLLFISTQSYRIDLNSVEPMTIRLDKVGR